MRKLTSPLGDLIQRYRTQAKKDGRKMELEITEFTYLVTGLCFYCGQPPNRKIDKYNHATQRREVFWYNGIDRVDNDEDYTSNNCVTCCKQCNFMKRDMSLDDFLDKVNKIYKFHFCGESTE